ncbi:hypothetical protein JZU68_02400, partial [bacterium]|nr:hypothetical protein [bacterium]
DSLKQNINYNIGVVYIEQNAGDSAKFYLKKVFEEKNAFKNSGIISRTYSVLADYYLVQNLNLPLAKMYVDKAEKHA